MQQADRHLTDLQLREHFALECYKSILAYMGPHSTPDVSVLARLAIRHADVLIKELSA